jgi:hypothetical protein
MTNFIRKDKLWHDASDIPKKDVNILYRYGIDKEPVYNVSTYTGCMSWDEISRLATIKKWMYLSDIEYDELSYKIEERTKNLSLHDIHIGDWVQCWNDIVERYSCPMKVVSIFDDGTVYLVVDDEQGDPFEYNIKDIDGLPITEDILKGFGFKLVQNHLTDGNENDKATYSLSRDGKYVGLNLHSYGNRYYSDNNIHPICFIHDLQYYLFIQNDTGERNDILTWKGVDKKENNI